MYLELGKKYILRQNHTAVMECSQTASWSDFPILFSLTLRASVRYFKGRVFDIQDASLHDSTCDMS